MLEFIQSTVEYQNWGLNAITIGSLGTIFFTFILWWGFWKQNHKIWKERSGESVSVIWFSYGLFSLIAFFFYGVHIQGISVIFNGIFLALISIPIVFGLWKYKEFTKTEKVLFFLFALMALAMAILPWKDQVFIIVSAGAIYALSMQVWELWDTKKTGVVEIRLLVISFFSSIFWVIYGFAIGEWVLKILASTNVFLLSIAILLWWNYWKQKVRELVHTERELDNQGEN